MIGPPYNPRSVIRLTLIGQKGEVTGYHKPLGSVCPHYLFKGDKMYVRFRDDAMIECGEGDRPTAMLLVSAMDT